MPTRLIYVGNNLLGSLPRLTIASKLGKSIKYAALSYCWGPSSSMRLITTSKTLSARLASLPWKELPPLFHDAFLVTRELGLEYIWIDALCIVQDDEHDWEIEAARMGDTYRNAHITIVAAQSRSTNDSFLRREKSNSLVEIPFVSRIYPQISGNYQLSFSPLGYVSDFVEDVERSKWNERGWTFQERLLSHRVLFFGKRMMFFECRTHRQAENYRGTLNRNLAFLKHLQSLDDWGLIKMSWRKLVEDYSSRAFTFNKDRLPALAGLANELSDTWDRNGDPIQYLAGHWREGLDFDLIWMTDYSRLDRAECLTTNNALAPSWSWCSSPRKVSWLQIDTMAEYRSLCSIVHAQMKLTSSNLLGGITGGFLDILGELSHYKFNFFSSIEANLNEAWYRVRHYFGGLYSDAVEIDFRFDAHIPEDDLYDYLETKVWLALICDTTDYVYGLVLTEAENCKPIKGDIDMRDSSYTLLRTPLRRLGIFKSGPEHSVTVRLRNVLWSENVQKYAFRLV
jgi:Heterokaryon incompatibility protein (HET)